MPSIKSIIRRPLRRMLQIDRPNDGLTSAEAIAHRDRNFRWNFTFATLDVILFMGGLSLLSGTTFLPLFISKLSDSTIPLALVAIISQAGFPLPQLFTSNHIERLARKKPVVVQLGFFTERLPVLLLIAVPLLAIRSPLAALICFLLLYSWFSFGGGLVATAWQDLVARLFPVEKRGLFFGGGLFGGTLIGIGLAAVAGRILDAVAFPLNFVYIFAIAAFGIIVSWGFLAATREPVEVPDIPRRSMREYLAELPNIVRTDTNFRNFLTARFVLAIAEMGSGFLTVAAILKWGIADSRVAAFTTAALVGQTLASLLLGVLADRYGHRLSLEISAAASAATFALAWFAPTPFWFTVAFFLLGFFTGARIVSGTLVVLEFCAPAKRPTYVGLTNTLIGIASTIAPLLGALLTKISYPTAFAASMFTSIAAFLMLRFWVKEPRFANVDTA